MIKTEIIFGNALKIIPHAATHPAGECSTWNWASPTCVGR
jgi:hypothetical protein